MSGSNGDLGEDFSREDADETYVLRDVTYECSWLVVQEYYTSIFPTRVESNRSSCHADSFHLTIGKDFDEWDSCKRKATFATKVTSVAFFNKWQGSVLEIRWNSRESSPLSSFRRLINSGYHRAVFMNFLQTELLFSIFMLFLVESHHKSSRIFVLVESGTVKWIIKIEIFNCWSRDFSKDQIMGVSVNYVVLLFTLVSLKENSNKSSGDLHFLRN